jgi:signal transduction histidine kinase
LLPKRGIVDDNRQQQESALRSWLVGEFLLIALLSAALALWGAYPSLPSTFDLPMLLIALDTAIALASALVAVLAGVRFAVDARRTDLLLSVGFGVAALSMLAFEIAPILGGGAIGRPEAWTGLVGRILSAALIVTASFARGQVRIPERALFAALGTGLLALLVFWSGARALAGALAGTGGTELPLTIAFALLALLYLGAMIGFGLRFQRRLEDLDSWLALAATLWLFSSLNFVFTPLMPGEKAALGDFLRLLACVVLVVGAWRAIRAAEFGRAVSEERARVAREIHDGLAQYLFALSTHLNMLRTGAELDKVLPRLEEVAALAQQEARFAVLALSSAGGSAPFDAALRRYVEFLCADGKLEVDIEIDPEILLAPDEQIEIFRIVQEGLGNVRRHANAERAVLHIVKKKHKRMVIVRDDGDGFDDSHRGDDERSAGQGLKNMKTRSASIGADFAISSELGVGTTLEVALRA